MDESIMMGVNIEVNRQDILDNLFNEMSLIDIYETWSSESEKEDLKEYLNG